MPKQSNLHVFSAGAVAPPIKKCAEGFKAKFGTEFEFSVGKAENLIEEIAETQNGDLLTSGSEFILDHAQLKGLVLKDRSIEFGEKYKEYGTKVQMFLPFGKVRMQIANSAK